MSWKYFSMMPCRNQDEYFALGSDIPKGNKEFIMSRSELMKFAKCPKKWLEGIPEKKTSAMQFGTLVDLFLTDPETAQSKVAVPPPIYSTTRMVCPSCGDESTTKSCRKCKQDRIETAVNFEWNWQSNHCREWKEAQETSGKIVVDPKEMEAVNASLEKFVECQKGYLKRFCECSQHQMLIRANWHSSEGFVLPFKFLLDAAPIPSSEFGNCIGDFKTTRDASPRAWQKHVLDYQYHIQAAIYLDAINAGGRKYEHFVHLIGENVAPFMWTYRFLHPDWIEIGRNVYLEALERYCHCLTLEVDEWPEFDHDDCVPPQWLRSEHGLAGEIISEPEYDLF